jgi:acetyl-CoA carboxylase carboxyltransferase component
MGMICYLTETQSTDRNDLYADIADFLKSSPLKPPCQMNRNLVGCIYGRSSIKIARFLKTSPLKLLAQMNRNLVGSIYGRSSIKIARFVLIG